MSSGGYLIPPSESSPQTPQQRKLWTETATRLERFLPGMMAELFPVEEPKVQEPETTLPVREKIEEAETAGAEQTVAAAPEA